MTENTSRGGRPGDQTQTADVMKLLAAFNEGYKGLPIVGGLASGAVMGAENWLCLNGRIVPEAAVGVAMVGDIEFEVIVSQGCRPIGKPLVVTSAENNMLYGLAGRPALEVVRDTAKFLGAGIANVLNVFNPEVVVICGGVTLAGDSLFVPRRSEARRRAFKPAVDVCRIVPGELTGTAGVYGAAAVFMRARWGKP